MNESNNTSKWSTLKIQHYDYYEDCDKPRKGYAYFVTLQSYDAN